MLAEGLQKDARRWTRVEHSFKKSDTSSANWTERLIPNSTNTNSTNSSVHSGLAHLSKLPGNSSTALPASRKINVRNNDSSGSDMDASSESDEHLYDKQYSFISLPQDGKLPNGVSQGHIALHDTRFGRTAEDHSSDSASSIEVSFTQCGSNDDGVHHREVHSSANFSPRVTSHVNGFADKQHFHNEGMQNRRVSYKDLDDARPSAPPIVGSLGRVEEVSSRVYTSKAHSYRTNPSISVVTDKPNITVNIHSGTSDPECNEQVISEIPSTSARIPTSTKVDKSPSPMPTRYPTFHASGLGPWCAVLSYESCVRLCLNSWAKGCSEEAPYFLNNECAMLRNAFGLQHVLLQSEEEWLARKSSQLVSDAAAPKSKRTIGKMKVQVRKVKIGLDPPPGCNFSSLKAPEINLELIHQHLSRLNFRLHSGWEALRKVRATRHVPRNATFSRQALSYLQVSSQYLKQVSNLLKNGAKSLNSSSASDQVVPETYFCSLKLKSSSEEDVVRMQAGSGETHVFLPDGLSDDLVLEVYDSKGNTYGRVLAQIAAIADDPSNKVQWWPVYKEPEHELVGRVQLYISYSTSQDESNHLRCGSVAETVAYDLVLEVAMKCLDFQERKLLLDGPWKWLVAQFASYYGVSDAYTKLRYLSYVMDVATPTKDCLTLILDLLYPVLMKKSESKGSLSHQENRILGEIEDEIQQILTLIFENYKSLDESLPSGMMDVFGSATGEPAPALAPAVKLYNLLHDVLSPEAQLKFTRYFQAAAKKRSRRHLAETDEFVGSNSEGTSIDPVTFALAYQKMKSLVLNFRNEILTDIEIHGHNVLPSFIDLPNLSACIYSTELCSRLRAFFGAYPPSGPSPPVIELVIATADFQRDLSSWNISPIKGGVDAKDLFHSYIIRWIEEQRDALTGSCKLDVVKWSAVKTDQSTTPFIDDMYDRLMDMMNKYEVIIHRWPEFTFFLEKAITTVEKATFRALEKQYTVVLSPLKESIAPKIFGLKYVQKIAKGTPSTYVVPDELGVFLNSIKRMLDLLHSNIETKFKSWSSLTAPNGNAVPGEQLSEIRVMLRAELRNFTQAVVEKLMENTKVQSATKLKKIIQDSKENAVESDVLNRMQSLKDLLINSIHHLSTLFDNHLFIIICRNFWDRMGQDILSFLENLRDNQSCYKGLRITVSILDEIFVSEMQKLLGNTLAERDMELPSSIREVRSMLCKDSVSNGDNYYF